MKNAIFITVRTSSTRLPKKCLLEIVGIPTIVHLIRRVKMSRRADGVVLCTTTNHEDDILCEIATQEGIHFFRGSEKDKLERWRGAVQKYGVEFFVTADGDDVLCEPELIDLCFAQYQRTQVDFIEGKEVPCGAFTYGIKATALEQVCRMKGTDDTEMMWVYFTQTGKFKCATLEGVPAVFIRPEIRMTLDYEDDFQFFKKILEFFSSEKRAVFGLRDVLIYLDAHPEVIKINQHRQQEFLDNQKKKTSLVLKAEK